jgi:serine/threonine-protein kinase
MLTSGQLVCEKYRVGALLGEGGMGAVYEAVEEGTGRRVALKVMLRDKHDDATQLARFQREASVAGSIDTQHIARVFDAGIDPAEGTPFIAMERLDGEDVQHLVRRLGPVRPGLALRICAQACVGLAKAHEKSVIHRDIKSANVFVARQGDHYLAKLLDFGVAKTRRDPSSLDRLDRSRSLTQTGGLVGSPLYMSPEQAIGAKGIDERTDVFSLGTVLYEMLTGKTPHDRHDTLGRLIIAICQEPATHVQDLAPWVPASIAAIVHRALEINPGDRYPSALAMLDAIGDTLPDGWEIAGDALTVLSDAERRVIEPRVVVRRTREGVVSPLERTVPDDSGHGQMALARTSGRGAPLATARGRVVPVLGTLAGAGLAAFVIVSSRGRPPAAPASASVVAVEKPASAPEPAPLPAAASAEAAPPAASALAAPLKATAPLVRAPSARGPSPTTSAPRAGGPGAAGSPPAVTTARKLGTSDAFE